MIPKHMREKYNAHISSARWKEIRERLVMSTYHNDSERYDLSRGHFYCQKCWWNFHKNELEVHHLHYNTLGKETRKDLAVVCNPCHRKLDQIRAEEGEAASIRAYEDAAFDGWASKVYGEDWADYYDTLYDKFYEWREMKNEEEWY